MSGVKYTAPSIWVSVFRPRSSGFRSRDSVLILLYHSPLTIKDDLVGIRLASYHFPAMESSANARTEAVTPRCGIGRIWNLSLVALILGQGWVTLSLFGPQQPWQQLLNDQPIVSGRHPLHL